MKTELLYKDEHMECFNYEKGHKAQIELCVKAAGEVVEHLVSETELVILSEGSLALSYGTVIRETVAAGKIMLFAPGSRYRFEPVGDCRYFVFRIRGISHLCECMSLERLYKEAEHIPQGFNMLFVNDRIRKYLDLLAECMQDGLRCTHYFSAKLKELFFLLRGYYGKQELIGFFAPMLSNDAQFMLLMYENYGRADSVKELAGIANYSVSGFKKQFNRVFGMPPSEWVSNQKAAQIYRDLNVSDAPIKDLVDKYHFASPSSFSKFCQQKFGKPPGQIRTDAGKGGGKYQN